MAKCAKDINEQSPWQELTPGGEIYEGGTARMTITGEWRANIPVWDPQKCKQCLLCAPFCPDASIPVTDGRRGEFDFEHCKGCGIYLRLSRSLPLPKFRSILRSMSQTVR